MKTPSSRLWRPKCRNPIGELVTGQVADTVWLQVGERSEFAEVPNGIGSAATRVADAMLLA